MMQRWECGTNGHQIEAGLPKEFRVSRLNTWLLWITVVTGLGAVGVWSVTVLPLEIAKRFGG
jgi:hypothetical protein